MVVLRPRGVLVRACVAEVVAAESCSVTRWLSGLDQETRRLACRVGSPHAGMIARRREISNVHHPGGARDAGQALPVSCPDRLVRNLVRSPSNSLHHVSGGFSTRGVWRVDEMVTRMWPAGETDAWSRPTFTCSRRSGGRVHVTT